jgi:formyl-CoA transferase
LIDRPEYRDAESRVRNRVRLAEEIEAVTAGRPRDHWLKLLDEAGVPCGPILDYREVFEDAQVRARGIVQEVEHPEAGRVRVVGPVVRLSETPARIDRPSPRLGEHTAEVLSDLGVTDDEIRSLAAAGVAGLPPGKG